METTCPTLGNTTPDQPTAAPGRWYYVKNWRKYQHYKDRNPPWIKLYRSTETDRDFQSLSEIDQWRLVRLWLLASDMDGRLPRDSRYIQGRLGLYHARSSTNLLAKLEATGLISQRDVRGDSSQSASTETETETEAEKDSPPNPLREGEAHGQKSPDAPAPTRTSPLRRQTFNSAVNIPPREIWPEDLIQAAIAHNLEPPLPSEDKIPNPFKELWKVVTDAEARAGDDAVFIDANETYKTYAYNLWADINPDPALHERMLHDLKELVKCGPWMGNTDPDYDWNLYDWLWCFNQDLKLNEKLEKEKSPCQPRRSTPNAAARRSWRSMRSNPAFARSQPRLEAKN